MSIWPKQRKGWLWPRIIWPAGQGSSEKAGGPENGRRCGPFSGAGKDFCPGAGGSESVYSAVLSEGGSEKSVLRGESLQDQEGTFRQQEPGVSLYNISSSHLSAITELASRQSGRSLNLPGGLTVHTEGAYLIFDRPGIEKEEQQSETELIVPGTVRYGKYRLTASIFPYKNRNYSGKNVYEMVRL